MLTPRAGRTPFIAVAVGSGQLTHYAVEAGADLLLVLNAGLYRNLSTGSLAASTAPFAFERGSPGTW